MKTMFKALWLIMILLAIGSCKKTKYDEIITPTENNKLVFVNDESGTLYAVNASKGTIAWKAVNTAGGDNYITSPAVTPDAVVFSDYRTNKLFSFNTPDGVMKWSKNYVNNSWYASPIVKNNIAYVVNYDNYYEYKITGYTLGGGVAVKEFGIPNGYNATSLNMVNDMFIVGGCGAHLLGISQDGIKQWEYQGNNGCYHTNPAVYKGVIYILSSGGKLSAVNAATGAEIWSRDESAYVQNASVVYNKGMLYITGYNNKVYAFEAYDGDLVHTYTLPDNTYTYYMIAPAVYNDKMYVLTENGTLVAYDVNSEAILWQKEFTMNIGGRMSGVISFDNRTQSVSAFSSVVIANNTLFMAAGKSLYAVNLKGETMWQFNADDYIYSSPVVLSDFNTTYRCGNAGIIE
jgi:outer membrane protein assembly factor BamB